MLKALAVDEISRLRSKKVHGLEIVAHSGQTE